MSWKVSEDRFDVARGDYGNMGLVEAIREASGGEIVVDDVELQLATIDIGLRAEDKVRELIHRHFPKGMTVLSNDLERWGAELMALWLDKRLERLKQED